MAVRIQARIDTAANLAAVVPGPGEPVVESDTGNVRFGNGATPVAQLPYLPPFNPTTGMPPAANVAAIGKAIGIGNTRSAAYTLGGCSAYKGYGTQTMFVRIPIRLPKTATRLRIHVSNVMGLSDYPQPNGPSINAAWLGQQNTAAGSAAAAQTGSQAFPAGTGVLDNGGEWVSGWLNPSWDTSQRIGFVTLSATTTGTNLAYNTSANAFFANSGVAPTDLVGSGWTQYGDTPFSTYVEYEYVDDGSKQVLFLGDSAVDGFFMGPYEQAGPMQNWLGHIDSFPEAWARNTGSVAIINAYASAKTTDWSASSTKWQRFAAMNAQLNPAAVVIHIGLNDLFNGSTAAAAAANVQTILQTMRANYPTARIFYAGAFSVLSSNTSLQASARVTMNSTVATLSKSVIDGYFEFTSIYDPASGASEYAKAKYVSPDSLHYTPEGYQVMARDIDLT